MDIINYLKEHENKDMLRFLTCGSVDDGKLSIYTKEDRKDPVRASFS